MFSALENQKRFVLCKELLFGQIYFLFFGIDKRSCSPMFSEILGLKACNFTKKRLQHSCFPVNITKFLRTRFFTEHLRWLLQDRKLEGTRTFSVC